jgi:hydroxymethylpyrimidine/phosphomethylpyrimidine kinase
MRRALTIAGSDSGGGAGIQADLKTFMAFGVHGMSVITALTAQNTVGVQGIFDVSAEFVRRQMDSVLSDIGADAVKTGMLSNGDVIRAVADGLRAFGVSKLVVDPVMVAKSGDPLLAADARRAIRDELLPLATVVTPNVFEAETLLGREIRDAAAMRDAARELGQGACRWVVIKGGGLHIDANAVDVVWDGTDWTVLTSPRVATTNTQGTGCTFASAIAAGLARGAAPLDAIRRAKEYVTEAIRGGPRLGSGHGPVNHMTGLRGTW